MGVETLKGTLVVTGASKLLTFTFDRLREIGPRDKAAVQALEGVKVQLAEVLPLASVAWQVTVLVPFGKLEPLGGVQLVVEPGQLSLGVAA